MNENIGGCVVCVDDIEPLNAHFCLGFGGLDFYGVFVVIFCAFYVIHFFIADAEHEICVVVQPVAVRICVAVIFYCVIVVAVLKKGFSEII